ncbi:MAG: SGNH/GDSL hydrolase family protein [Pirellulales bacterium]
MWMVLAAVLAGAGPEFALRDGDRVVFLGDSITAARTYTKIVEDFTLLRYPDRKIRFFNAGIGGDTAAGALKRLDRDVFSRQPTVVTVCFGLNDIGWGLKADDAHKRLYLDSLRELARQCRERNVRLFLCSSPITNEAPDKAEVGFLQKMGDEAFAMAGELQVETIDVQRPMREIQRRILAFNKSIEDESKQVKLHLADGVHLNDLGHLAMAYAFLKGWHAPAEASSLALDAQRLAVASTRECEASDVRWEGKTLAFTRLDRRLPFNHGIFFALQFLHVPIHRDFNRYELKASGLPAGTYEIRADGRGVAKATAEQLERGVDLASMTLDPWQPGGPWDAQAALLKSLTDARHELDSVRLTSRLYAADSPLTGVLQTELEPTEEQLVALQRQAARPRPYRFTLTPIP